MIDHYPCYWVVETASNRFLRGGISPVAPAFNAGTETLVSFPTDTQIDPRRFRYDAAAPSKIRPATLAEIAADIAAARDEASDSQTNRAEIAAMLEFVLRRVLGTTPTPAQRAAARAEYKQILRAILG